MRNALLAAFFLACWGGGAAAAPTPGPMTDGQVAGALNALDREQIDLGDFLAGATRDPGVKQLAASAVDAYTALDRNVAAAASRLSLGAADSPLAATSRRDAVAELEKLKKLQGPAQDRAYVDDVVALDRAWLAQLDGTLAPSARLPEVRSLVNDARQVVSKQLDDGQRLQQTLKNR